MSPMERTTRVLGTSRTLSPREASMRPGAPGMTLALFAPWATTYAQSSSSRPLTIMASARRTLTMRLGRTSRSCGFWFALAMASTSARSPVTASVSDLRSVVVVTTRSFWASAVEGPSAAASAHRKIRNRGMTCGLLVSERVGGVSAQDERGLEQDLVDPAGAAAVVGEVQVAAAVRALRVLVAETEAQELRRIVREERLDGPLLARVDRVLRPVVAEARQPLRELAVAEGTDVRADVEALA